MSEIYKIHKPKTRPIQIEPWFSRYLTDGQLKVLIAILNFADFKTRKDNSFASNKTIAFYAGFGQIKPNTKEYFYYQSLSEEEKKEYKKKKIKNAIQTVKNIKKQLEELGVIKREIINNKSYITIDLEWGKEKYLKEFNEFFNDVEEAPVNENDEIKQELDKLQEQIENGNVSKEFLANKLQELSNKISDKKDKENEPQIPKEDVAKLTKHIMNSKYIQDKIKSNQIKNPQAYELKIKHQILSNQFNGVKKYYNGLINKELSNMIEILEEAYKQNYLLQKYKNTEVIFAKITYDKEHKIFKALYKNLSETFEINFPVSDIIVNHYLDEIFYTTVNAKIIKEYPNNYKNLIEKLQKNKTSLLKINSNLNSTKETKDE